jgi:hypothetical protein
VLWLLVEFPALPEPRDDELPPPPELPSRQLPPPETAWLFQPLEPEPLCA